MPSTRFLCVVFILPALTGCGTIHNLKDPPDGPAFLGTGVCYPGGGVVRTGLLATMGPAVGVAETLEGTQTFCKGQYREGAKKAGHGVLFTLAGLGAWLDLPLSVAGDILTLPVAYARQKQYPWATTWGKKRTPASTIPEPSMPTEGQTVMDDLNKPPE